MKKVFCLLIVLLALSFVDCYAQDVVASVRTENVEGIEYILNRTLVVERDGEDFRITEINAPGEAMVTSGDYSGELVIPSTFICDSVVYKVTSIGKNAFFQEKTITSVTIPETVTCFGDKAFFQCRALVTIVCNALIPPELSTHPFHGMNLGKIELIIPAQSLELYSNHEIWGSMVYDPTRRDNDGGDDVIIKTNYILDDALVDFMEVPAIHYEIVGGDTLGQHYANHDSSYNEYNIVSYRRTFSNTNWQALYVPLNLVYNDWKDRFEVAEIYNILEHDTDKDGIYDKFYAQVEILGEESEVEPHKLYLIRSLKGSPEGGDVITVSAVSRVDVDSDPLYRVYTNVIDGVPVADDVKTFVAEGSGNVYTFKGQYSSSSIVEPRDADGNPIQPYCYAMTGGELKRPNPAMATGVPLGAFRWWLEVIPGSRASEIASKSVGVSAVPCNEGATSMEGVCVDLNCVDGLGIYYDLGGRSTSEPHKGIFICNGKKYMLR